jgi:peptidoglycan/LPS O-acetylase OafA/YrhL
VTAATHPGTDYRPDIDGLRAIAVLIVIGFHAEIGLLRGGFTGVDVFFVISGYLISGIVFRSLRKGTFSFREFYVRRINRIVPSLAVVLAASLVAGWVISMPTEYRLLGKHTFGGSAFASNIILWREAGYFDSPHKPFLHLWSLAVEEQFYLIWPPLALVAWRRKWNLLLTIGVVVSASFAVSVWMLHRSLTVEAFYFPGTRLWQIGAGALLSQVEGRVSSQRGVGGYGFTQWRQAGGLAGIVLLAATLALVDHETPWPGFLALLPVAGTLLLIGTGPDTWVGRKLLANRLLVGIGLISYPLYLWHWPLIVFARLVNEGPLGPVAMTVIVALSALLAWLTYRFVEVPIRFGARKARSAALLLPALVTIGCVGLVVHSGLIRPRLFAAASALDEAMNDREGPRVPEGLDRDGRPSIASIPGAPDSSVLLTGDSHMAQYWPRFLHLARTSSSRLPTVLLLRYGSCVPMPGVERRGNESALKSARVECARFHRGAMEVANDPRVKSVVFGASWPSYLKNQVTYLEGEKLPLTVDGPETDRAFALLAQEFRRLSDSGKRVYVVLDNPVDSAFDPASMLRSRLPGFRAKDPLTSVPRSRVVERSRAVNARLIRAARIGGATVIDPVDFLCGPTACPTVSNQGKPIYRDNNHMRASFVRERATYIDSVL